MTEERKPILIASGVAIAFLLLAIPPIWPYGYYVLLRWLICGISVFLAYTAYEFEKKAWTWTMGIIALLFNPLIPVHLDKETWIVIDFTVAVVYFISIFIIKKK